ncbi:MAG: serine/threonine protein kinase, partial [Verrucomicrobiaceae bacterium]
MKAPLALLLAFVAPLSLWAENWPMWRGPRLDGSSEEKELPTRWSASENILWRTELPGSGHASPIVWGDKVFTVAADEDTQERLLICLNRQDGGILWKQVVIKTSGERIHRLNSLASSTPATDGERVFSTFLDGKQVVVAAYDFQGKQLWLKRPG